jgi:hypothetical protein
MLHEEVHQGTPEGAVTKFKICICLIKIHTVTHCHTKQVKYPLQSEIEKEMTLRKPF